jgi:hypothetical protein
MANESNALLRSRKDLTVEAYKYFESLADIATEISIAVALVNMCNCLMKYSPIFHAQCKERQGNENGNIIITKSKYDNNMYFSENVVWFFES